MIISNLKEWIYHNTSFTSDQASEFVDSLDQITEDNVKSLLESAYEAGFDECIGKYRLD